MTARVPTSPAPLECVRDGARAAVLLGHPMRLRILDLAAEPASATELAEHLGEARQKVNYHVRRLRDARFLRPAGQRRRRNLIEHRYVASARSYVLAPEVLGPLSAEREHVADALSAAALLALTARAQGELARAADEAARRRKRLATLSISADVRFESAAQRARFTRALHEAVVQVIARHAAPARLPGGAPAPGRPYRLILGCYPVPKDSTDTGAPREA